MSLAKSIPARRHSASLEHVLDLDNQLCFALYSASRQVVRSYATVLGDLDVTYPQYLVLLVLWEWERERDGKRCSTVKALGARLDLESGTLTPLLRRLEAKGLISRKRALADERELSVRLTRRGKALRAKAESVPIRMLEKSPLSIAELGALREQLKRLRDGVAA